VIVTVTANPSLDRTYVTGPVLLGEVNRARVDTVEASGKGVNVSRALHAAGVPTLAVLPAGGPEGEQLRGLLESDGLPCALVPVAAATRTNVTLVEPGGRTTKINSPGRPLAAPEQDALASALADHAGAAGWVVFSGTLPPGKDADLLVRLIDVARAAGARTAVDASGDALRAAAEHGVDLLAPNTDELAALTMGVMPDPGPALVEAALAAATELTEHSGGAALVSLGPGGALWVAGGAAWHGAPVPVTPINTVGAGDALLAGWLAGPGEPAVRLARAVAWGTAACLMPGTSGDVAAWADPTAVTVVDL
jgi:1-phosphofructokinase